MQFSEKNQEIFKFFKGGVGDIQGAMRRRHF